MNIELKNYLIDKFGYNKHQAIRLATTGEAKNKAERRDIVLAKEALGIK